MLENSNSLTLLSECYKSDEENDNESSTESGTRSPEQPSRLPLPDSIQTLYKTSNLEEVVDIPENHGGRVRSFPHERGNWVTSVYILYDRCTQLRMICDNLIKNCQVISDFHPCDSFHISLSRTVILRHHWIDLFVDDLKGRLKLLKKFYVDLNDLAVYVNDEGTRTFLALNIHLGFAELTKCIGLVDQSLLEFNLPTYYKDPSFHISLVWCVGNKKKELVDLLPKLQATLNELNGAVKLSPVHIDRVSCKIGNRFYTFSLS